MNIRFAFLNADSGRPLNEDCMKWVLEALGNLNLPFPPVFECSGLTSTSEKYSCYRINGVEPDDFEKIRDLLDIYTIKAEICPGSRLTS